MKKIFAVLISTFLFFSAFADQRIVSFCTSVSTGVIFYGSEEVVEANKQMDGGTRVIIGTCAEININPIKEVSFFGGCDLLSDFYNAAPYASNHLEVDLPLGFSVYPGLKGFCVGIAYCVGFRSDFFNLEEGKTNTSSPWGNGFKILTEYNFAHCGKSPFLPTVGLFWKRMPRGNDAFDNTLCAYVKANF